MILTIFSALMGLFSSLVPDIFKYFQDKKDKAHELAIMDRQMEMAKLKHDERLEEIHVPENLAEIKALYGSIKTNIVWVDALNGCVRPIIALLMLSMYYIMQIMYFQILTSNPNIPAYVIIDVLWSDEDQAFLGYIMGFYFGGRNSKRKSS